MGIIKQGLSRTIFQFFNYSLLALLALVCIIPFLHVLFASFSDPARLTQHIGFVTHPLGFSLKGYKLVLENRNIITGYLNTIFYIVTGGILSLLMTSLAAYVTSRRDAILTKAITFIIVFTMFFSGGLIPYYLLVKNLGMFDTRWAMIIPGCIVVYYVIIMRTAFQGIPSAVEESARIDGANDIMILFRVIIPLSIPTMAVITLFYTVAIWNTWFSALIFLHNRRIFPLQLFLREILLQNNTDDMIVIGRGINYNNRDNYKILVKYCTIIVATLPILFVYPFLQKYFIKGIMLGAIKG